MSLIYNGTTITDIVYNGVTLDKVIYNGVEIFTKSLTLNWTSLYSSYTLLQNIVFGGKRFIVGNGTTVTDMSTSGGGVYHNYGSSFNFAICGYVMGIMLYYHHQQVIHICMQTNPN